MVLATRLPIGTLSGFEPLNWDIQAYNKDAAATTKGNLYMLDLSNASGLNSVYKDWGTASTIWASAITCPVAGGNVIRDYAPVFLCSGGGVAQTGLDVFRVAGVFIGANVTNTPAAAFTMGAARLVLPTTAGNVDLIQAANNSRTFGFLAGAHTAGAGAEVTDVYICGVFGPR